MADTAHPKHLTPLRCPHHKYQAYATRAATPYRHHKLNRASRHGWRPGTEQVKKKKRAASHGDGEPLLVAKNDLPMHAHCWQFRQPWRFCGMDDAMWLHRQVFLASQSALVHHARPPSSKFPWFFALCTWNLVMHLEPTISILTCIYVFFCEEFLHVYVLHFRKSISFLSFCK